MTDEQWDLIAEQGPSPWNAAAPEPPDPRDETIRQLREALEKISQTEQHECYLTCYRETEIGVRDYLNISGALRTCGNIARAALERKE